MFLYKNNDRTGALTAFKAAENLRDSSDVSKVPRDVIETFKTFGGVLQTGQSFKKSEPKQDPQSSGTVGSRSSQSSRQTVQSPAPALPDPPSNPVGEPPSYDMVS